MNTNNVEEFFMFLPWLYLYCEMSSPLFWNVYSIIPPFLVSFVNILQIDKSSLYILNISPLLDICIVHFYSVLMNIYIFLYF